MFKLIWFDSKVGYIHLVEHLSKHCHTPLLVNGVREKRQAVGNTACGTCGNGRGRTLASSTQGLAVDPGVENNSSFSKSQRSGTACCELAYHALASSTRLHIGLMMPLVGCQTLHLNEYLRTYITKWIFVNVWQAILRYNKLKTNEHLQTYNTKWIFVNASQTTLH